jgi:hypothetical protein
VKVGAKEMERARKKERKQGRKALVSIFNGVGYEEVLIKIDVDVSQ